jgi:homoserine kinase type II
MLSVNKVLEQYSFSPAPAELKPLQSAGGMSGAQFWRIVLPTETLILRRWPKEHPSTPQLRFIHTVLQHAAAHGCNFLPLPLTTRSGESFVEHVGHLWELAPLLAGTADYAAQPTPEKLAAAMRALATFHNATATFSVGRQTESTPLQPLSAVHRHLIRLRDLTTRHLAEPASSIRNDIWPGLATLAYQFLAALPNAIPRAISQLEPLANVALPLQPCLRDIWHDHVLFTGDEVTGLVDFGAIAFDTPATDIARLVGSLADATPLPFREGQGEGSAIKGTVPFSRAPKTGNLTSTGDAYQTTAKRGLSPSDPNRSQLWQHALAAYNTIRPLSENETRAAHALSTSAPILAGCNWLRWIYIERREFENHAQVIERFRHIATHVGQTSV